MRVTALALAATLVVPAAITAAPTSSRDAAKEAFQQQQRAEAQRVAAAKLAAKRRAAKRAAALRLARARRARITRAQVLSRGRSWVRKRIPYSQSRYYKGYRTDCSGFVSMAWRASTSYTTRSIGAISKRIGRGSLRPGDAVLYSGHIVLFVKWKSKRAGTFVCYEEANSRADSRRSIRRLKKGRAIRYRRIVTT